MASRVLLVEGLDDKYVMERIRDSRGFTDIDVVRPSDRSGQSLGGIQALLRNIPVRLEGASGLGDIVGVIVDADTDLNARWRSVSDRFAEAGYLNVPSQPNPEGTILEPPLDSLLPRAGIWIMPDNANPGILEDFLQSLAPPQTDPLMGYAVSCVNAVPAQLQRFSDIDKPKAIMHTWLAWQQQPGRPYGTAIQAGFLNPHAPSSSALASWLETLFSPPPENP